MEVIARAAVLLLASLLVATAAHADPTPADRVTARGLMQQGRELRDKGDLAEALKRFKGADDLMHAPTTALELARTQVALGQLVEARNTIQAIRRIAAKANEPAPFKEARAKAEELDTDLSVRVPALIITLKGTPEGEKAAVTIDGDQVPPGAIGLAHAVNPGHHVVTAKSASAEGKLEIDVHEGDQKPVEIALVGAKEETEDASDEQPAEPPPTPRSHGPTLLTWGGVGLAVVGVAAGSAAGVMSMSKKSALQGECASDICGPSSYGDYSSANSLATVSTIGFAAAGVGAAVAIVTLIVGHGGSSPAPPASAQAASRPDGTSARSAAWSAPAVTPWIGLGAGGVGGTF